MTDASTVTDGRGYETPAMYEGYELLRAQGPVVYDEGRRVWLVLGFTECDAVLRDEELFAHPTHPSRMDRAEYEQTVEVVGGPRALVLLDPEAHAQMHGAIMRGLNLNLAAFRTERVRPVIDHFMRGFVDGGRGEFATEFADPVPAAVIASVLGLPWDEPGLVMKWKEWDTAVLATRNRFDVPADAYGSARTAATDLNETLRPVVRARRAEPQGDFISQIWEFAPKILPDCTEDDVIAQCRQLFQAGSQTTTHMLCNATALLFSNPELWARLRADRDKIDRFVEEVIRVLGVLQQRPRVATRDTVLAGQRIAAGERVYAILPAASRDPSRFERPFSIDLDGGERRRHMSFSVGPRVCAGAAFARTEAREVLRALFENIDDPALDPDREPPAWTGDVSTDWRPLHVRFTVRSTGKRG